MQIDPIEWHDGLNTGIEVIDTAHQQLFRGVFRIASLLRENDSEKSRFACIEAVKFLKSYTLRHFAEEEEVQRKLSYSGYAMHRHLHDNLRDITLPALDKDLEENDYSRDAIERFIAVVAGWLTGHFMIEDLAIVGKNSSKW